MYYYKRKDGTEYGTSATPVEETDEIIPVTQEEYEAFTAPRFTAPVFTKEQIKKRIRIDVLKGFLANTDYKAIKFAEGEISDEEYTPTRLDRRAWREEINQLQEELENELGTSDI